MWHKDETEFKELNGYQVGDQWFPRVTKILEIKSKPALDAFFKEMGSYEAADEVKNKSAAQGTLMHEAVQGLFIGGSPCISPEVEPGVSAFQKFNEQRKIEFHPEFIERRIWSPRHRYAGTLDAVAWVDGKFGVLDIKTSTGFYPEYNLQTAAYVTALQEFEVKKSLALPRDIETRWILRIDQHRICKKCRATLREKGGRAKIRSAKWTAGSSSARCPDEQHEWGALEGDVELKEFPDVYKDMKAFVAAKILWEWENDYWLQKIGYTR
ncbi:MAG: hypothetical protein HY617_00580 [Candidatus Sungbacteria bacterium]|nr:hypothetical protein [Candidatus Sungbacteria bacterium]